MVGHSAVLMVTILNCPDTMPFHSKLARHKHHENVLYCGRRLLGLSVVVTFSEDLF
jgi:hypothetical protein